MEYYGQYKNEGATTLPIIYRIRSALILAVSFMIIAGIASHVLYFMGIFNIFHLVPHFIAIAVFLTYSVVPILRINQFQILQRFQKGLN
jgi:geranylgeranylglycerol-phosphate geranylgeranyltransferase